MRSMQAKSLRQEHSFAHFEGGACDSVIDSKRAATLETLNWKYCIRFLLKELLEMRFSKAVRAAASRSNTSHHKTRQTPHEENSTLPPLPCHRPQLRLR